MRALPSFLAALLLATGLAGRADAGDRVLDIVGPAAGGTLSVGIHDDFLFLEGCGSTCNAPAVFVSTITCQPGATPLEIADALAASFVVGTGYAPMGFTAISDPGLPGRLVLSGPDQASFRLCVDGFPLGDTDGCCGNTLSTAGGTLLCAESPESVYCTSGTSQAGCHARVEAEGAASAAGTTGFELLATRTAGGSSGMFFLGTHGAQSTPWGDGTSTLCVRPPLRRAGLLAGSGTPGACDGSFVLDLNELWCPTCPAPELNPGAGAIVNAQLWYADPLNTSRRGASLSNALEFTVGP